MASLLRFCIGVSRWDCEWTVEDYIGGERNGWTDGWTGIDDITKHKA